MLWIVATLKQIPYEAQRRYVKSHSGGSHYFNEGNLPTLGNDDLLVIWEFALSDIYAHPHNAKSVEMLGSRGLDFNFHGTYGINSHVLAQHMIQTGLLSGNTEVHWVTFHDSYDFGYLIKQSQE